MSDPRRFIEGEGVTPLARALLRSVSQDGLDDTQTEALARALGLSGAPIAGAAPTPGEAPTPGAASPSPGILGSSKWALTFVAGMVVGAAVLDWGIDRTPKAPLPAATVPAPAPSPRAETAVPTAEAAPTTPEAVSVSLLPEARPEPSSPRPGREPAGARASGAPAPSSSSDLAAETRALERVRVALGEHRVVDARAGLGSYERSFPQKLLANEARVLEIETLYAEGRRVEGEAAAHAFLASSPDSPYASRVRSLVAGPALP
jgi:hypothetical protein